MKDQIIVCIATGKIYVKQVAYGGFIFQGDLSHQQIVHGFSSLVPFKYFA